MKRTLFIQAHQIFHEICCRCRFPLTTLFWVTLAAGSMDWRCLLWLWLPWRVRRAEMSWCPMPRSKMWLFERCVVIGCSTSLSDVFGTFASLECLWRASLVTLSLLSHCRCGTFRFVTCQGKQNPERTTSHRRHVSKALVDFPQYCEILWHHCWKLV